MNKSITELNAEPVKAPQKNPSVSAAPQGGKVTLADLINLRFIYRNAKQMFTNQYDIILQYFYQTQRQVATLGLNQVFEGEFLNDGSITDNYGAHCAEMLTSAIMGYLWKGEKGTVRLVPPKNVDLDAEVKDYFVRITNDFHTALENKESRFETSLDLAIFEKITLGTAGMAVQRGDYQTPIRFQERSVLNFFLGYDENGNVDTIGFDRYDTAKMIIDKYGMENVPDTVKAAYTGNNVRTRFVVTELITPRKNPPAAAGKLSMPYAVFEFMPNDNFLLGEGGYESFPVPIMFGRKLEYESYGRSLAMKALPTVRQLNVVSEILAEGGEATARPPLGMYDNGSLAGKVLDLTGGALSVFNVSGAIPTEKPVFPLYVVGDLRVMFEWQEALNKKVAEFFLIDKLFDFGTGQRMQNPEVNIQNSIRADSIGSIYINTENFMEQTFQRGIDIMFAMGLLGVKNPDDKKDPKVVALLAAGLTPFKIPLKIWNLMTTGRHWYGMEFISPAARIMRTEALQAATGFLQTIGVAAQTIPDFAYVINAGGTAEKLRELFSADLVMVNSPDQIAAIKQQMMKAQAAAQQAEQQKTQAQANQMNAQAMATKSGAVQNMNNPQPAPAAA